MFQRYSVSGNFTKRRDPTREGQKLIENINSLGLLDFILFLGVGLNPTEIELIPWLKKGEDK